MKTGIEEPLVVSPFHPGGCERSEPQCSFQLGALFILALVFVSLLFVRQSYGQAVAQPTVVWNPDAGQAAGYYVYYGLSSGLYDTAFDVGDNTSTTLQNLTAQTYYIAVTAYDSNYFQSAFSPELVLDSLTASAGPGGTISPSGTFFQSQGASQTFTISPSACYATADVLVDGTSVGALGSYTFSNIATNHTISTTFAIISPCTVSSSSSPSTYSVTPSAGSGGLISPNTAQIVNYDWTASFTVSPNNGYDIASVTGCGGTLAGNVYYTGAITSDCTVTATFSELVPFPPVSSSQAPSSVPAMGPWGFVAAVLVLALALQRKNKIKCKE